MWTQEIIWELRHGPGSADARTESLTEVLFPAIDGKHGMDRIRGLNPPRMLKTHLDASFFKRQLQGISPCPRFVYVLRDPKDVVVSYYYYHLNCMVDRGDKAELNSNWGDFFDHWIQGHMMFGSVFDHVAGWWGYRHHPRVTMITFEEIKRNHMRSVERLASFLDYSVSKSDMEAIVEETTFAAMKARPVESYGKYLLKAKEKASGVFFPSGDCW